MINASKKKYQEFSCGTILPCFSHLQFEKLQTSKCYERKLLFTSRWPPGKARVPAPGKSFLIVRYYKILHTHRDCPCVFRLEIYHFQSDDVQSIQLLHEHSFHSRTGAVGYRYRRQFCTLTNFSLVSFRIFILMRTFKNLSLFSFFSLSLLFFCVASCNAHNKFLEEILFFCQKIFVCSASIL